MVKLRDAQLELLEVVLRDEAELAEECVQGRARLLSQPGRISAPAGGDVVDQRPRFVAARKPAVGELLRERVGALGGTLDVTSVAGAGTTIVARLPCAS